MPLARSNRLEASGNARALGYSTQAVARILGVKDSRLRSFVRAGFVHPARGRGREYRFSFQDIVVLRAAQGLMTSKISAPRVRQAMERLREELPAGRSLTELKIFADGGQVVARSGNDLWEADSGQRRLDFEVRELAETVRPLSERASQKAEEDRSAMDAEDWFWLALEWEATAFDEAKTAYARSIALREGHFESHLNLGRLLHEEGELAEAETHYRRAQELEPGDVTATFNLGVVLQDRRQWSAAISAYQRAVELDPSFPDAHFNLATLHEARGDKAAAIRSLKMYKTLRPKG